MLCVVSPVVEFVVQELQELTEFNEKKLKSTTDTGLNLAQRRRERRSRACVWRGSTDEVNRGAIPGAHGRLREEPRQRHRKAVGLRFPVSRQGSSPRTCVTLRRFWAVWPEWSRARVSRPASLVRTLRLGSLCEQGFSRVGDSRAS